LPGRFFIEPLDKHKHDRAAFSCEHDALTAYLRQQATQDIKKHVAAVFVLTPDGKTVAGYYTLSQYAVDAGDLPEAVVKKLKLPRYPQLPATLIGRLARALDWKGHGVGELLLIDALRRALGSTSTVESVAVVVDAKDEPAKAFYKKYGFLELPGHENRLFLPMKTIDEMFRG
jgi:predicted GNAT family N-acyltransferase